MFKSRFYIIALLSIISLLIFAGCSNKNTNKQPISKSELLMGTVIKVTLYDSADNKILNDVFDKITELEKTLSINEEGTQVDKINAMSGIAPVKVSDDTLELIKLGLYYSNLSNGKFDITIGPLVKLWNIGLPGEKVPTQDEINKVIPLINYKDIVINEDEKTVYLTRKDMKLDLGGIAKGYTADVISNMLKDKGVKSAIIDLGGNIFAHGSKLNNSTWRIGVQNPSLERGNIIGILSLSQKSIVTSGIYERFFEQNGIKYHHILNPKTGYPYDNEIVGVTIISDTSTTGDALSTSVFAMGIQEGLRFIENLNGVDAIFITKDNSVYITSGVKDIFELTNTDFTIKN